MDISEFSRGVAECAGDGLSIETAESTPGLRCNSVMLCDERESQADLKQGRQGCRDLDSSRPATREHGV